MTSSYIPGLTQQSLSSELAFQLNNTQTQLNDLTSQLSAGVNVTKPSDNPTALVQILGVQSQLTRYTQYQANATDGLGLANLANSSMSDAVNILQQARVTLLQAGSPGAAQGSSGLIASLQSDMNSLMSIANTTYLGAGVFGGTSGVSTPYTSTLGTFTQNGITVTTTNVSYNGNTSSPTRTVAPSYQVPVSVTDPFSTMFTAIQGAINDLKTNQIGNVTTTDLQNFDSAFQGVQNAAGQVGSMVQQLTLNQQQATLSVQNLTTELGSLQNLNMAQATTQFQQIQNNYQIALYVTSKSVQQTLAQYLG